MNIISGLRTTLGRCSFDCETETVKEINFNGVKVRVCEKCAGELVKILSQPKSCETNHDQP